MRANCCNHWTADVKRKRFRVINNKTWLDDYRKEGLRRISGKSVTQFINSLKIKKKLFWEDGVTIGQWSQSVDRSRLQGYLADAIAYLP